MIGDGPLMADVRRYVDDQGMADRIRLRGRQTHHDTLALVRCADVLMHHAITSPQDGDTEGQPLAILEAMAAGIPVVATRHAGIPEVVDDGLNGRLVAEQDVNGMAAALLDLAADPTHRRRLGAAGRATIIEGHGHDRARRTMLTNLGLIDTSADQPVIR
jgi:colanic acid/amylovoran biosynthesis glycosyltransferase